MARIYNSKHDRQQIREKLLAIAASGAPRPKQVYCLEGRFLSMLTCETTSQFDPEFDAKIRALRPDWFKKPKHDSAGIKAQIRVAALAGEPRPGGKLGNAMSHYLCRNSRSYDDAFRAELHALRPDWFIVTRMEKNKRELLELARSGAPKPKTSVLKSYTQARSRRYDAAFATEIRALRPDWFDITEKAKRQVFEFAKKGGPRPSGKNSGNIIYHAFRRYTRPQERFDPAFTALLKATRPDWFEAPKRVADGAGWRLV